MRAFKRIVVGVDGSKDSRHALMEAVRVAHLHSAALSVHQMIPGEVLEDLQAMQSLSVDELLVKAKESLDLMVVEAAREYPEMTPIETEVRISAPSAGLMAVIEEVEADLLVVGSRTDEGRQGRLGAIAARCVRLSPISALCVHGDRSEPFRKILACTDFSTASRAVLAAAARMAADDEAPLEVVHVHSPPWMSPLSVFYDFRGKQNADYRVQYEEVLGAKLSGETNDIVEFLPIGVEKKLLFEGDTENALLDYIAEGGCDLVVVGGHGASGFVESLLGTTTERILLHSSNSVLIVKPTEGDSSASAQ